MFAAFIVGGAGITVLYHVLVRQRDPVRDAGIAAFARKLGLSYFAADPFDLLRLPFELIRTGGQAMILNVVSGEFRGMAITAFEYRRFSRERVGDKERPWAFSCVIAALPTSASEVVIERQSADAFQLGRSISRAPRIQTESVEFDRAFAVHARDPRFALSLRPRSDGMVPDVPRGLELRVLWKSAAVLLALGGGRPGRSSYGHDARSTRQDSRCRPRFRCVRVHPD